MFGRPSHRPERLWAIQSRFPEETQSSFIYDRVRPIKGVGVLEISTQPNKSRLVDEYVSVLLGGNKIYRFERCFREDGSTLCKNKVAASSASLINANIWDKNGAFANLQLYQLFHNYCWRLSVILEEEHAMRKSQVFGRDIFGGDEIRLFNLKGFITPRQQQPGPLRIQNCLNAVAGSLSGNSGMFSLYSNVSQSFDSNAGSYRTYYSQGDRANRHNYIGDSGPPVGFGTFIMYAFVAFFGGWGLEWYVLLGLDGRCWPRIVLFCLAILIMASGLGSLILYGILCDRCHGASENCQRHETETYHLHVNTVPHKYPLTIDNYWGTVIVIEKTQMANVLDSKRQLTIIGALAEGSSIRSIERITGVHRDTIMRLGVRVGKGCATLLDRKVSDLPCEHLEFDEL